MALLHRVTGQDDVAVGSPIANRNRQEIENLIGFFVNSLVLRCDLRDLSFRQLVARARDLRNAQRVRVHSERGGLEVELRLDPGMKPGCVSMTNGWWASDGGSACRWC